MRRIFKVADDATASMELTEQSVKVTGDYNNFFYADSSGIYLVGNPSFLAEPQNMRIASMFSFPTTYEMLVPSTVSTPRPMLIPSSPVEGFMELAGAVTDFLEELI